MKTIEGFIKEIEGSTALQDELKTIKNKDDFAAFLKKYEIRGTVEDFEKGLKVESEGEISDDVLEAVSGGEANYSATPPKVIIDKFIELGILK